MNALNAYNKLNANVAGLKKASEKLSSGYRINRAGDDAAGLAVSEKMRSQIRGLNQAVRNSQDGINMIQTFEGAAQETHSILQRMKELASESANGTYDNATDRAAIQLEFDQLNDELNQIADTDFNGTIVLNGGEMADGLKQVDGEFDYRNKADQVAASNLDALAAAQKDAQTKIDEAKAVVDAKKKALELLGGEDISQNGSGPKWGSVDSSNYTKEAADGLWKDLGYKYTDGAGTEQADVSDVNAVDVSFRMKDDGTWEAYDGYDSNGNKLTEDQLALFKPQDPTDNGGFTVKVGAADTEVNSVFDSTEAKAGDTVTLTFTNTPNGNYAPTNAGFVDESLKLKDGGAVAGGAEWTGSVALSDNLETDGIMDTKGAEIKKALDALFSETADKSNNKTLSFEATYDDKGALDTVKIGNVAVKVDVDGKVTINGVDFYIEGDGDGKFTISTLNADGKTKGTGLLELTVGSELKDPAGAALEGTVTGNVTIDAYNYDADAERPDIEASKDRNLDNATEVQRAKDALRAANEALAKAQEAYPKSVDDLNLGVTKADAFDNSTARMTYTDHIILQTGSRTKDAVDFTFKYNTDGSADMGELKANLNISARADGLNTANLSLADQDSANEAIDQIDKAINKVSMVRATFGSIQNRLEHKITNLTTTSENLTEAESSIRDTDMASEMMNYTKFNILQQAAQSMLAQANQQPQSILQLLG